MPFSEQCVVNFTEGLRWPPIWVTWGCMFKDVAESLVFCLTKPGWDYPLSILDYEVFDVPLGVGTNGLCNTRLFHN